MGLCFYWQFIIFDEQFGIVRSAEKNDSTNCRLTADAVGSPPLLLHSYPTCSASIETDPPSTPSTGCNTLRRRARADHIQERQVVVWRRYRQIGFGAEVILVVDQRGVILGEEQVADAVLKRNCPVIRLRRGASPGIGM